MAELKGDLKLEMLSREAGRVRLRVALSGAHGTGKTTLARAFSRRFNLVELPTPGRLMASKGLPVNQSATVTSQCLAWLLQFRLEEETPRWVSTRSLVDVWAYGSLAAERRELTLLERELFSELTAATAANVRNRYDVLFYLPARIPLVADDVRSGDPLFQSAVDAQIRDRLEAWALDYVTIDVTRPDAVQIATAEVARAAIAADQATNAS